MTEETSDLGPCCSCRLHDETVRNVMMLDVKGPVPGKGWGCVVCDLPADGAVAVLCDDCVKAGDDPVDVIIGDMSEHGRVPVSDCTEPHDHDMSKHPEATSCAD